MPENEIFRTIKPVIQNKMIIVFFVLLSFFLIQSDYTAVQIVTLLFGSVFIVVAFFMLYINSNKSNTWIETFGEVMDIKWYNKVFNGGYTVKHGQEVISYKTKSSKHYTVTNDFATPKPKKEGEKIKIFYNPKNEKEILVYDFFNMYLRFFFVIAFGAVMVYYTIK